MQPLSTTRHLELVERAEDLERRYGDKGASAVVEAVVGLEFPGKAAVISSFGTESAVLLHLISAVNPHVPVIFLDTGRHFKETIAYRTELAERLGLDRIVDARPDSTQVAALDPDQTLAGRDPDMCCHIRKTLPMLRALKGFDCLMTGRKRFQASTRSGLGVFEVQDNWIKVNPLAGWSKADLDAYFAAHELPHHGLEAAAFRSIGCEPCTRPVAGADYREGRWAGQEKTECGIHFSRDGKLVRGNGAANPADPAGDRPSSSN